MIMRVIFLLACIVLQGGCSVIGVSQNSSMDKSTRQSGTPGSSEIGQEAALAIAREQAAKTYGALEGYNASSCDDSGFWRVFFEPKSTTSDGKVIMYVVVKQSGWIASQREIAFPAEDKERLSSGSRSLNKEEAVAVARSDGNKAYGSLEPYALKVCELSGWWVVIFSPREGLDGGGPEYVIDKETGAIVDKKYYQ